MRHGFSVALVLAAIAALTGCSSAGTSAISPSGPTNVGRPQQAATHQTLQLRPGPSEHVCGPVADGYVRCNSLIRTDIPGHLAAPNFTPSGYGPSDLQTAYNLTRASARDGTGQTVGIVDAFNDPNIESDLAVYRSQFGLPPCTSANGCFTKVNFARHGNIGWAEEESLDVDMASAICPNCHILLVEAKTNSTTDLTNAEQYAVAHATVVSNSWGGSETTPNPSIDSVYSSSTVAITASTGDSGFNKTAQWPAILPTVTGAGGTTLTSVSPRVESAWSGAGSGCSIFYAKPSYQSGVNTGCTMRAEGDLSGDADPNTGVAVYDTFHVGGWLVFGGTSVSSPILASVFALAGNSSTNNNTYVYSHASSFNDITSGSNGSCGAPLCTAGPGWDGPTGLGSPDGTSGF